VLKVVRQSWEAESDGRLNSAAREVGRGPLSSESGIWGGDRGIAFLCTFVQLAVMWRG